MSTTSREKKDLVAEKDFLRDENNNLRQEIGNRVGIRYTLLQIVIGAFATIVGFGFQGNNISLMLLYPPLAVVLLFIFIANSHETDRIECYIIKHIEPQVDWKPLPDGNQNKGWQTVNASDGKGFKFVGYFGARLIFLLTELFAIVAAVFTKPEVTFFANWLGVSKPTPDARVNLLLVIACISLVLTLMITFLINAVVFKLIDWIAQYYK